MNDPNHPQRWAHMAAAARRAIGSLPPRDDTAPLGFAARVVARAFEQRREWIGLLWQRWSWRAALLSATASLVVAFVADRRQPAPCLEVPLPVLDLPALTPP